MKQEPTAPALDSDEALLLVDVAGGRVWQDVNGYNWHEHTGTRLREPLRELGERGLVELVGMLGSGGPLKETHYRQWQLTRTGVDALEDVKAALAERGYTVDDVRLRRGRLQREGVL